MEMATLATLWTSGSTSKYDMYSFGMSDSIMVLGTLAGNSSEDVTF